ncbi:hypothetical protein ACS0TY_025880 [Phlomoides rotata]
MDGHSIEEDDLFSEEHMHSDNGSGFDKCSDHNVDDKPKEGLVFDTIQKAGLFYIRYGTRMGFNVRRSHKGYNKEKTIVMNASWECTQAVFSRSRKKPLTRNTKPQTRFGCQACFWVVRQDGLYKVTKFVSEHNHKLLTPTSNQPKFNRFISSDDKAAMTIMNDAGHQTCHSSDYLKLDHGGPSNLSLKNKKYSDLVRHEDAIKAFYLFEGIKIKDTEFIYEPTFDESNSLSKLFWTGGFSRAQYKLFGDVLVLDSTCKSNMYRFPLVILSGVDNNLKTCVFGAALMYNETIESYVWLFQKFLDAMGGKAPATIMYDQDLVMGIAIAKVFPLAKHRLCSWHLLRNCMQCLKKPGFCNALGELMKTNLSIDEFEQSWKEITETHGVARDPWVLELYSKIEMWSATHCRDHFIGIMMNTAESSNAHFKDLGKEEDEIAEFLKHYFNDLRKLRVEAYESQYEPDHPAQPTNRGPLHKLVNHAAEVYSDEVFVKVQNEIVEEQGLLIVESRKEDRVSNYKFAKFGELDGQQWCVKIDVAENTFYCDCQMLESIGLPCRHLFSAFKQSNIMEIPSQCIRERWTKAIGHLLLDYVINLFSVADPRYKKVFKEYVKHVEVDPSVMETAPCREEK